MQRLSKNLALSAVGKISNSLKSGEIRQIEAILELMSEDGSVVLGQIHDELYPQSTKASANVAFNRLINRINEVFAAQASKVRMAVTADKKAGARRECWFEAEPVQFPIPHPPYPATGCHTCQSAGASSVGPVASRRRHSADYL